MRDDAPFTPGEIDRIERSLIVGLSRGSVQLPGLTGKAESPVLATLAMIGHRKRFQRPVPPPDLSADPVLPEDPRPILSEPARDALLRLVAGRDVERNDAAARAAYDLLRVHGLRLHPFDLPRLTGYLRDLSHSRKLGPAERAWLSRGASESAPTSTSSAGYEAITEDNWTIFSKAERIAFLSRIRRDDPGRARALIEAVFAGEPAPLRAEMVGVMRHNADAADAEFLMSLLTDRARSVKDGARAVLATIPDTDAYCERREEALAALEKKDGGLVKGSPRLRFNIPGAKRGKTDPEQRAAAVRDGLNGVRFADIAAHADMAEADLIPAAVNDHALYRALLGTAASEGRWDLILAASGQKDMDWPTVLNATREALDALPRESRRERTLEILKNANPRARPTVEALDLLCDLLRGPLDAEAAARFLSGRWIEALHALEKDGDDEDGAAMACAAAAVMPAECAEPFLAALAPFPDVFKQRAVLYRRFADALSGASHRTEFPAQTA